jgi:hypothetical protein
MPQNLLLTKIWDVRLLQRRSDAMTFLSTDDDHRRRGNAIAFLVGLFIAFFHADPRVITRAERERGWASLKYGGIRRFDLV